MTRDTYNQSLDEKLFQLAALLQAFNDDLGAADVRAKHLVKGFLKDTFKMTVQIANDAAPFSPVGRTVIALVDSSLSATQTHEDLAAAPLTLALQTAEALEGMMLTRGETDVRTACYSYARNKTGQLTLQRIDPLVVLQQPDHDYSTGEQVAPLADVFATLPLPAATPAGSTHIILLSAGESADHAADAYAIQKLLHNRPNTSVDVVALTPSREENVVAAVTEGVQHHDAAKKPVLAHATDAIGAHAMVDEILTRRFQQNPLQTPAPVCKHGCAGLTT